MSYLHLCILDTWACLFPLKTMSSQDPKRESPGAFSPGQPRQHELHSGHSATDRSVDISWSNWCISPSGCQIIQKKKKKRKRKLRYWRTGTGRVGIGVRWDNIQDVFWGIWSLGVFTCCVRLTQRKNWFPLSSLTPLNITEALLKGMLPELAFSFC